MDPEPPSAQPPPARRPDSVRTLIACIAAGIMGASAFAPLAAWPLAWVALAPLFWVIFTRPARQAIPGAWLGGAALVAGVMHWVGRFGVLPWLLLAAVEGLAAVGAAASIEIARPRAGWRRVVFAALAWTAWDWLRTLGPFGVPWAQVGHSQIAFLPVAQVASVLGVDGLTFLAALSGAAIADVFARGAGRLDHWRPLGAVGAAIALVVGWGYWRIYVLEGVGYLAPQVRAALVQANVESDLTGGDVNRYLTISERQEYLAQHESLTAWISARKPDLVVWPESALPGDPMMEIDVMDGMCRSAREARVWLIAGGHHWRGESQCNSAFAVGPDGALLGRYDKVHLVPFGEYVPGRAWLPLVSRYPVISVDLIPGNRLVTWKCGTRVGPMICFESVFPDISRALRRKGAQVLVVLTNDAWFGPSAASEQHMQIGRFRAIEEGVSLLRAALSGVSSAVAPSGRLVGRTRLAERAVLVAEVPATGFGTVYAATGPAFPALCLLITLLGVITEPWRRRQGNSSQA